MSRALNNFDPLSLLDFEQRVSLSELNQEQISNSILNTFWEFLIIKLSEKLDEDQLEEVLSAVSKEQRYQVLKKHISNIDEGVDHYLRVFEEEFKIYE